MDDRDNVRVDLLKFRRKAYLSYLQGSKERKTFLKTILQNELKITKQEMSPDIVNLIIEGNKTVLWDCLKMSLLSLSFALLNFALGLYLFPHIHYFSLVFISIAAFCVVVGVKEMEEYYSYYKSIDVIKKYENDLKQQMTRISNDIKRLDGPHGF